MFPSGVSVDVDRGRVTGIEDSLPERPDIHVRAWRSFVSDETGWAFRVDEPDTGFASTPALPMRETHESGALNPRVSGEDREAARAGVEFLAGVLAAGKTRSGV